MSSAKNRIEQAKEKAKQIDSTLRTELEGKHTLVNAAIVGCSKDRDEAAELISRNVDLYKNAICRWVEVDTCDMDVLSETIQGCDLAIIVLSNNFVVAPMAFQTLIFILRSIRKPSRYYNLMPSYMELVKNADYAESSISLLVGNSMVYTNWQGLMADWVSKFKNVPSSDTTDRGPLPPMASVRYFSCYSELDAAAVEDITSVMERYSFEALTSASNVPSSTATDDYDRQSAQRSCVLVFVSSKFASDKKARGILDAILIKKLPMVVVVVTDLSGKSWMQTGLGILLSNELWVDFSVAPFYKPGERVPSFQKRIRELSIRLRNACIGSVSGLTAAYALPPTAAVAMAAVGITVAAAVTAIANHEQEQRDPSLELQEVRSPTESGQIQDEHGEQSSSQLDYTDAQANGATRGTQETGPPLDPLAADPVRVFVSHTWADSGISQNDFGPGGFAHFSDRQWDTEHAPLRYATMLFQQHGKFRVDADANNFLDTRDFFYVTAERLHLADTSLLFWSPRYVKSFFCYNETFQSMVWQHKRVVIVFLEDFDATISALCAMPQHERLMDRVLALRGCAERAGAQVTVGSVTGVSVVNKTYEQVCGELCEVLARSEDTLPFPAQLCSITAAAVNTLAAAAGVIESEPSFDVLISYCWSNSAKAYHEGHVSTVEGRTDPRAVRNQLERATGLRCWLDAEHLLGSAGLFQGIHAALSSKSLKCVILCVSDEYVKSPNCMMELEYAIRRIPCIVMSVGNGYAWRVKLAGYFVAYQETFDFVISPFPHSEEGTALFAKMAARVSAICRDGAQVTTTALR
jgi:hypothetical protein